MKSIIVTRLVRSERRAKLVFSIVLHGLKTHLDKAANKHPSFRKRLREKNFTVQIKLQDNSCGRYYTLKDGVITSKGDIHATPDVTIFIANAKVALDLLLPPRRQGPSGSH